MWLLRSDVLSELRARAPHLNPTSDQQTAWEARSRRRERGPDDVPELVTVEGGVATIEIVGLLTPRPNLLAWLFGEGNTSYADVQAALQWAAAAPAVNRVELAIDSPGGRVDGLFETVAALERFSKPLCTRAASASSAAFALAAAAGPIEAVGPAAAFGSIGVAVDLFVDPDAVSIASTHAPKKRPDVRTAEGQAVVREELDQIHQLFAGAIARGRKTTVPNVNTKYGRGGVLLAERALKAGMIDSIAGVHSAPKGPKAMDIATLKAQFPAVYEAAVADGTRLERERVLALLDMAKDASGKRVSIHALGYSEAFSDIKAGTAIDASCYRKYMQIAQNQRDSDNRQDDDDAVASILEGVTHEPGSGERRGMGDKLADSLGLPAASRELVQVQRNIAKR